MECILKGKNNELKTNGTFRKKEKNYYIDIELKENDKRENNYEMIYSYDENSKKITLVNCYFIASNRVKENNVTIYKYKANYVIDGWIENIHSNSINQIYLYFYELDKVFIKNQIEEKLSKKGSRITVNETIIHLYENAKLKIAVYKLPIMDDSWNEIIIATPAKIVITFKERKLEYGDIFEYVRKIENIFGFIVGNKLNLLSMEIFDGNFRKIRYRYIKEKELCKYNEADLTDIHSLRLIKQLIKQYFENEYVRVYIDNYYEYLYNELSSILKFTSSISILEILAKHDKYLTKIKSFNNTENKKNNENDEMIKTIKEKLTEKENELIDKLYTKNGISLRYIFRYFFEKVFNCEKDENTIKLINNTIKTRIYYIHGGKNNKKLDDENLYYVSELLSSMVYLLIIQIISPSAFQKEWVIIEKHKAKIKHIFKIFSINIRKEF